MRKHFLILMLLTLLPLAGWAEESTGGVLDQSKFSVSANLSYGATELPTVTAEGYTATTHYTVETSKFFKDAQGSESILTTALPTTPTGTYYIRISGAGDYASQDPFYIPFLINGVAISASDITIAEGTYTYNGSQQTPGVTVKVAETTLIKDTDYTLEYGENINAGDEAGIVTVKGIGNYSGNIEKKFEIAKKAFSVGAEGTVTIEVSKNTVTYDGTDTQTATIVVTDKVLGKQLTSADYTVTYGTGHKNVGNYDITVNGKGNYKTNETAITADKKLIIAAAPVLVTPSAKKTYDGTNALTQWSTSDPTALEIKYAYDGFVDATDPTVTTTDVKVESTDAKAGYGEYKLSVTSATEDKFTTSPANYTFIPQVGTFNIEKRSLYVYASDQTVAYGADIDATKFNIEDCSSTVKTWATATTGDLALLKKAFVAYLDKDGKLKVKASDDVTKTAILANYDVKYNYNTSTITTETPKTFGTLTEKNATITIALNASKVKLTKEYDGQPAAITEDITDSQYLTIVGGTIGNDKLDLSGLKATVVENTGAVTPEGSNGYKVTLSGATVSANADNYTFNYVTTYYKVTKKALTFTVPQQSAKVGTAVATAFDKTKFDVEGLLEADGSKDGIFELKLSAEAIDGDNIKNVNTGNYVSIVVKTGTTEAATAAINAKAANYSWDADATYKLVIVPAEAIVLDDSKDLSTLADADNATVTFTTRELEEGVWTTMVLPFEATVRQISNALGYAVVDMLQPTGNEMNFKIFMGTIPAYTPFLVKTDANVNMNTVVFATDVDNSFNIEALAAVGGNRDNLTQSNDKYNFIGKVDRAPITTNFWAVGSKMTKETFKFDGVKAETGETSVLLPLRAYITQKPGVSEAPVIYIEEPDGSTTAIGAITAEGRLVEADGWYTLNGVKLQGAPTQKGIYIRNGKKLVVK